jgi:hypothetical protein
MKTLILSTIFVVLSFVGNTQVMTIQLSSTKTYFKMGTKSRLTAISMGATSITKELIDTNLIIINLIENTATLKGSDVYYEETIDISSVNENYGVIEFRDETNNFDYVVDLNRNKVQRVLTSDNSTSVVEYGILKIIEQ